MDDTKHHVLTYVDAEDGYADGLEDAFRCTCGQTFQANGDVQDAFDHGWDAGYEAGQDASNTI